jgi:hypothetical protein
MRKIAIPANSRHHAYALEYGGDYTYTCMNYYDSLERLNGMIKEGKLSQNARFAKLEELLRIYSSANGTGNLIETYPITHDLEHTMTGLRWPDNWVVKKDGNEYRLIVLIGNEEVGEARIPVFKGETSDCYGVVMEVDEFGIPTKLAEHRDNAVHFHLETQPNRLWKDNVSGKFDLAIRLGLVEYPAEGHKWLRNPVFLTGVRSQFYNTDGIRPVIESMLTEDEKKARRGQLSFASDSSGALSFPDERGQLSLIN